MSVNGGELISVDGTYWFAGYPFETLPSAELSGHVLSGWYTRPEGCEMISADGVFDGSVLKYYAKFDGYTNVIGKTVCSSENVAFETFGPEDASVSSDSVWTEDVSVSYGGMNSYRSGPVSMDGNLQSVMAGYATGSGTLTFDLKTSGETDKTGLVFLVDEYVSAGGSAFENLSTEYRWTGETDWTECSVSLGEGDHVLYWIYAKADGSYSTGDDCA